MSPNANQTQAFDTALSLIERDMSKLFKGTHPGVSETHLLTDQFGRDVHVTWRGGVFAGIFYVGGNSFIRADCLGPLQRERWASPPVAAQGRRAA